MTTQIELLEKTRTRFMTIRDGKPGDTVLGCAYCKLYGKRCEDCTWREKCNTMGSEWDKATESLGRIWESCQEGSPEWELYGKIEIMFFSGKTVIPEGYGFICLPKPVKDYVNNNLEWIEKQLIRRNCK